MNRDQLTADNERLRHCINGLADLLALQSTWVDGDPSAIVARLLDSLLELLRLDHVCLHLRNPPGNAPAVSVRTRQSSGASDSAEDVVASLKRWIGQPPHNLPPRAEMRDGRLGIVPMQLGLNGEIGILAACAQRPDFPLPTERLVLGVAANQAALVLQGAQPGAHEPRDMKSQFRWLIDSIAAPVTLCMPNGETEAVNRFGVEYHRKAAEEIMDWTHSDMIYAEDLPRVTVAWERSVATGVPYNVELRARHADGVYRWMQSHGFPVRDTEGRIIRWCILHVDIDDRKQAEAALRASERDLRQQTETIPQMLWSTTAAGAMNYCNARLQEFMGISADEFMGDNWLNCVHPDDRGEAARLWNYSVGSGEAFRIETRFSYGGKGAYRWCLTAALPLRDEEGRIVKWHGACVDLHDWKTAQDELRETQAELAHMTRVMTMGHLTASIAHELNQPLAGITTNAGTGLRMLNSEPPNVAGARDTLKRTLRDAGRASEVIKRLRTLFSKKSTAIEPLDLNAVAQEVLALTSTELKRNSVQLQSEFAERVPPVAGDRIQLQQVILNFMLNASEAMSMNEKQPKILVIATRLDENGHVLLSVRDSGTGIDLDSQEKLFAPFFTTKDTGMGIGLSVSRSIIESHNGRLWAENNEYRGATFFFALPARPDLVGSI